MLKATSSVLILCVCAASARADYLYGGFEPRVIKEEHGLTNAAIHVDAGGLYSSTYSGSPQNQYAPPFSFELPSGTAVRYARLNVSWWGGTPDYTTSLDVTVNGQALPRLDFGGDGLSGPGDTSPVIDTNPIYDPNATCVYGNGFGVWNTCFDVTGQVALGGTNTVELDIPGLEDGDFDGRAFHWQITAVYDTPTDYELSYKIAEGLAYLRGTASSSFPDWTCTDVEADLGDFDLLGLTEADLWLAFTHGTQGQADWADLNGGLLGYDDLADGSTPSPYIPGENQSNFDFEHFDVTGLLDGSGNLVGIHTADDTPLGKIETSMNVATLVLAARATPGAEVIPEPCSLTILVLGLGCVAVRRRRS